MIIFYYVPISMRRRGMTAFRNCLHQDSSNPLPPSVQLHSPNNWYTRVFAYNAYGGSISTGPFKMWLNGTGITPLGIDRPLQTSFRRRVSAAADGIWYGIRYGTNALVKTDTSNVR